MDILPINAADLLQDPDKSALRQVHAQLEVSQEPGQALYFAKEHPRIRRPDFLLGLADRTYFALQVAAQPHRVEGGKLILVPPAPNVTPSLSPVGSVSAHSVGISKDVKKHLGFRIYVIPVAVFVGEDPDNAVQAWGITHNVRILFSADRLGDRLGWYCEGIRRPDLYPARHGGDPKGDWCIQLRGEPVNRHCPGSRSCFHARYKPDGAPGDHPACGHGERLHCRGWRRRSKRRRQRQGRHGGGPGFDLTNGCPARAPSVRS